MNKSILYILLLAALAAITGCKQKGKTPDTVLSAQEKHRPLPPKQTARYDYSVPPTRIDVEKAITGSAPVNLSQVASNIDYYLVGDDKYPITDIVSTGEGFIILNRPKLYYYRKGVRRKRIGLKTNFETWNVRGKRLHYDKATSNLYVHLKQLNPETGYSDHQILKLPPLEEVLARTYYLYPDSIADKSTIEGHYNPLVSLASDSYDTAEYDRWGRFVRLFRHTLQGDTICTFDLPTEPLTENDPTSFYGRPVFSCQYRFDDRLTCRTAFNDTVYRITDGNTQSSAYLLSFGKHRISARELFDNADRKDKAWLENLTENDKALFLNVYKENNSTRSGWLAEKRSQELPADERQVVYLKSSQKALALPQKPPGLTNDLDNGMPFWPDGQVDGYLYMIRPAKELKESVKLNGSPRQKVLKAFIESMDEKQNVMIVVK